MLTSNSIWCETTDFIHDGMSLCLMPVSKPKSSADCMVLAALCVENASFVSIYQP